MLTSIRHGKTIPDLRTCSTEAFREGETTRPARIDMARPTTTHDIGSMTIVTFMRVKTMAECTMNR